MSEKEKEQEPEEIDFPEPGHPEPIKENQPKELAIEKPKISIVNPSGSPENIKKSIHNIYDRGKSITKNSIEELIDIFVDLNEKGKKEKTFRNINELVSSRTIVGKLEIAYHQIWIKRNEDKKSDLNEIEGIEAKLDQLNKAEEIYKNYNSEESTIKGIKSISKERIDCIKKEKKYLEEQKEKIEVALKDRIDRVGIRADKRDEIAEKFIKRYEKKIGPIEKELEKLEQQKKDLEVYWEKKEKEFNEISEKFDEAIKELESSDAIGAEKLKEKKDKNVEDQEKAKDDFNRRKDGINIKIIELNRKVRPYEIKRNEFSRITHERPKDYEVGEIKKIDPYNKGNNNAENGTEEKDEPIVGTEEKDEPIVGTEEKDEPIVGTEEKDEPIVGTEEKDEPIVGTEEKDEPIVGTEEKDEPIVGFDDDPIAVLRKDLKEIKDSNIEDTVENYVSIYNELSETETVFGEKINIEKLLSEKIIKDKSEKITIIKFWEILAQHYLNNMEIVGGDKKFLEEEYQKNEKKVRILLKQIKEIKNKISK